MANEMSGYVNSAMKDLPQKKTEEIVGKDISIKELELRIGENGNFYLAKCEVDGKDYSVPFGGVLKGQIEKALANPKFALPVHAKIRAQKSAGSGRTYFTFEE